MIRRLRVAGNKRKGLDLMGAERRDRFKGLKSWEGGQSTQFWADFASYYGIIR